MILGAICDDFTGASDLANTVAKEGARATQFVGVPSGPADAEIEAGVVALKSRTIPAAEAVARSLEALEWLRAQGCRQYLFKYCSTFDSTDAGNIGPVAEALLDAIPARRAVVCPAFPATGRTVYQGHLFVGDRLLSESGMESHPLTPMTDPDLRRVLARQTAVPVGHVALDDVRAGPARLSARLDAEAEAGRRLIVVDAVSEGDLRALGAALDEDALITGGSGVALGRPSRLLSQRDTAPTPWSPTPGPATALAGSASRATQAQVARHRRAGHPCRAIDVAKAMSGDESAEALAGWAIAQAAEGAEPLVHTPNAPEAVAAAQARFGRDATAAALDALFADLARLLVAGGVRRLISAGGETSGAVVEGLGLEALDIGPEIDPGVPAMRSGSLAIALKSGNFGAEDFFEKAARVLGGTAP